MDLEMLAQEEYGKWETLPKTADSELLDTLKHLHKALGVMRIVLEMQWPEFDDFQMAPEEKLD